jgi:hypothetical protein
MAFCVLISVVFVILRLMIAYRMGKVPHPLIYRFLAIDLLGIFLGMAFVVAIAELTFLWLFQYLAKAWGNTAGTLVVLIVSMTVGWIIGYFIQRLWGLLTRPRRARTS